MPKMNGLPVHEVVTKFFADEGLPLPREAYQAVYAYILGSLSPHSLETAKDALGNHHTFDRVMKGLGMKVESIKELKDEFKFSWYAQCFWRAVFLTLRGEDDDFVRRSFPLVDKRDISMAISSMSEEQFAVLLHRATFTSTYQIPGRIFHEIVRKAEPICRGISNRKFQWIRDSDPAFDGFGELQLEATRVALYYSHFPDKSRISAYVIKAIYNKMNHLLELHSRPDHRRSHKLAEFKCNDCKKEYVHEKHVLNFRGMLEKFPDSAEVQDHTCPYWCPSCAKKGHIRALSPILGERVFRTLVLSMDSAGVHGQQMVGDTLTEAMMNPEFQATDVKVMSMMDSKKMMASVKKESSRFLRILLGGSAKFNRWLAEQGQEPSEDQQILAYQICRFLGIPYADIQADIGRPMRASVFQVRAGGEDDLVCAHTAREAADVVARHYRFVDAHDMQDRLEETVKVRCVDPWRRKYKNMDIGDVLPMS